MDAALYGQVEQVGPGVRRVLARNPSPFTQTGTQTHIVGAGEVAVVDPGPDLPEHVAAVLSATAGERIGAILVTHTHRDHSPAAAALRAATGAPVVGCAPLTTPGGGWGESVDAAYGPDRVLEDGEAVTGGDWTLRAVATPGHMSNHLCFAWDEARALFSGDHVMGWSTSVILPPDGHMGDYLASLHKLAAREDRVYYPAHGEPVDEPAKLVRGLLAHRRARETQIVRTLETGPADVAALVARNYPRLDPALIPAAGASVLAHLIHLEEQGRVVREGAGWTLLPAAGEGGA
ncbi:MAG TPA: MBL fold metallo-hydrolase [Sphingomonadaceae bacterium]|nr:MBL fold metallo-hydrolase [Sphingomonadaceae bacterium]